MIRAICFDLFETLVTEHGLASPHKDAWATRLGIPPSDFWGAWRSRKDARMSGGDPDFPGTLRAICAELGAPIDEAAIAELTEAHMALKRLPFAQIDPDILDMLHWLRQRGLRVGVVSNCTVEEVAAWADSQLAPLVDCTVWSYRAGVAKPHPRIYRLACEQLGVEPAEAIFIGDGGSDELAGAARAGMRSYQAYWFLIRRPNGTKLPAIQRFQPLLAPAELEGRLDALHAAR